MTISAIYSRRCWLDGQLREATLYHTNGRIVRIETGSRPDAPDLVDCGDEVLMPGVIDAHVHLNEPGRTDWEGFDTGTRAAAAGGTTTLVDMPLNASPVTTTADALAQKLEASRGKMHIHCGFYGGLVPGNLPDLPELMSRGILGVKAFMVHSGIDDFPNADLPTLAAAMPLLARAGMPLLVHCEWAEAPADAALRAAPRSYAAYLESRPKAWEEQAIAHLIALCRRYECPIHIVHLSAATALAQIADAKAEGLPITVETCPQYLYFNAEAIPDGNTLFKCAPPIRERANNEALVEALATGLIDFIATDHSPAPPALKGIDSGHFQTAWGGIAGIQFLLPAAWSALKNRLSLEAFIPLLTAHPARFLKIAPQKGVFQVGSDADFVVWSPETLFEVKKENILFRHPISPYIGCQFWGAVRQTWVNGVPVYQNQRIIAQNEGKWLMRP